MRLPSLSLLPSRSWSRLWSPVVPVIVGAALIIALMLFQSAADDRRSTSVRLADRLQTASRLLSRDERRFARELDRTLANPSVTAVITMPPGLPGSARHPALAENLGRVLGRRISAAIVVSPGSGGAMADLLREAPSGGLVPWRDGLAMAAVAPLPPRAGSAGSQVLAIVPIDTAFLQEIGAEAGLSLALIGHDRLLAGMLPRGLDDGTAIRFARYRVQAPVPISPGLSGAVMPLLDAGMAPVARLLGVMPQGDSSLRGIGPLGVAEIIITLLTVVILIRGIWRQTRREAAGRRAVEAISEGRLPTAASTAPLGELGQAVARLVTTLRTVHGDGAIDWHAQVRRAHELEEFLAGRRDAIVALIKRLATASSSAARLGGASQEIIDPAKEAVAMASQGDVLASQTQSTVAQLGNASVDIGSIVQTITDIAAQTSLLAINATIEAARAGSAGKGFAVVAHAIKELAKRTSTATHQVQDAIEVIQTGARSAAEDIVNITQVIQAINELQIDISAAVTRQRGLIDQVVLDLREAPAAVAALGPVQGPEWEQEGGAGNGRGGDRASSPGRSGGGGTNAAVPSTGWPQAITAALDAPTGVHGPTATIPPVTEVAHGR